MALALAQEGANVLVCDLGVATDGTGSDQGPADDTVDECRKLGVQAAAHYADVSDFKATEQMVKTCVNSFGSIVTSAQSTVSLAFCGTFISQNQDAQICSICL